MGVNRFFWPQEVLDQWLEDDKIKVDGSVLTIEAESRSYDVSQAVFFEADVGDGEDKHNLVGRVKEISELEKIGAEHYMDSVLVEDSAYKVVTGFTGEPQPIVIEVEQDRAGDISGAIATHTGEGEEDDDRELLARFLIENL